MTRHRLFIGIPILLMLGFALVFFLRAESPTVLLEPMYLSPEARTEAVRLRLHPLTSEKKRKAAEKKRVETWDDWVDFRTEILLGDWVKDDAGVDTPEEVEAIRARIRGSAMETAELFKAEGIPPPATPEWPSPEAWEQLKADDPVVVHPTPYEGPQTTDAIMAAYDAGYVELFPNTLDYDSHYSRKEWLQRFLDKGVVIENATDYDFYLKSRFYLIEVATDMERWKNGAHGVGPADSLEAYEDGFIERQIWERQIYKQVRAENPGKSIGIFFPTNHPDKYLPVQGSTTYVRRKDYSGAIHTWGAMLTHKQLDDLLYGIHPEGIEIIYIDDDYNVLSEQPVPYDPLRLNGHVITPHPMMTPEEYEAEFGEPMPEMDIESGGHVVGDSKAFESNTFDAERAKRAEAEFEGLLREFEKFSNMTDDQIEAELEKQATSQVPTDESLDTELREQMDPQRFSKAMATLRQYGREEGLRRLAEKDPAFAEQIQHFLERQRK